MMALGSFVRIHYLRPPDRKTVFTQRLIARDQGALVTLARDLSFDPPLEIGGTVALEEGSVAIWFTFPGRWYDVGLFHRADGSRTGIYGNVLTPPVIHQDGRWDTTDLYLDLWIPSGGRPFLLDQDELDQAVAATAVEPELAARANEEGGRLLEGARNGTWPPPMVERWSLERAVEEERRLLAGGAPETPQ
jgi:predicted RNA-binding protein associated with RNAse of E/G family